MINITKIHIKNKEKRRFSVEFIAVAAICAFWTILTVLGLLQKFDQRIYDIFLSMHKEPEERPEILLVDIDDTAINELGEWPWSRDKIADILITMRELGAASAIFDIEYISPSNKAIDQNLVKKIHDDPSKADQIYNIFVDNDEYFAKAVQFFGNAWLTINAGDLAIKYDEKELDYAKKRFLYQVEDPENNFEKISCAKDYKDFSPALHKILSHAAGAGFTNVSIDSDGVRRRIKLLIKYNDGALGQLSVAPMLRILEPEKIILKKQRLILQNCNIPGKDNKKTISIPLDKNGSMLINWLHKPFVSNRINEDGIEEIDQVNTSFNHNSIFYPYYLNQLESNIISGLRNFDSIEYLNFVDEKGNPLAYRAEYKKLLSDYSEILDFKNFLLDCMQGYDENGNAIQNGADPSMIEEYFALRKEFFENVSAFLMSDSFNNLLLTNVANNADFMQKIETLSYDIEDYTNYFNAMKEMYNNKFCIIGNTGTGTTDLGSTPFNNSYPNVGTHANVYNTIMTQDFIHPVEWYWGTIVAILLTFTSLFIQAKRRGLVQFFTFFSLIVIVLTIPIALMVTAGIYITTVTPLMIALTSVISVIVLKFRSSEKDKKFITNAFSQCLSKDVVAEIIKDPSKLTLGGKNIEMTAIFTDIQKFSGFSELLSASELVQLLNYYLTQMSEIIINERGTVDKYEGDAIVAFMGAPVQMNDHAARACSAAIKMKAAEKIINKEIIDTVNGGTCPNDMDPTLFRAFCIMVHNKRTIFTRIGINSGEIVAGFMGSENKKNYTVMGNNVNLASRLEGVNKQYCTDGILISEATRMGLNEQFVVRSLDRVQVVNVKKPIRLYELVGFAADCNENLHRYISAWEQTMRVFESGNYEQALEQFKKLLSIRPDDNVCKYYISLLEKFFIKGTYPKPQDDFGVAYNAENPADMDPTWIGTPKEIKGTFTLLQK
ncbi:MAG: adenylate/guanylate cyclase domain-containing protein [Treponema sp.]|nr:adenylate/guanylate cyclase domain-containing protein [Treponema sp.]